MTPKDANKRISEIMREARGAVGLSQRQASEVSGLGVNTISMIERGAGCSFLTGVRLLGHYDADHAYLGRVIDVALRVEVQP
ncbi:helix-turn-helix transcriptional regulator [Acetobacter sacchari]|uniref:Helix-turn-helix transcriptional regulator n=1 Tax=Acetobacter sacchari TaxID=2661687 RepID=A0ABS3M0Z6_9PROT|nr:helix-turn-helix transcriptional regulator [Acetobacter sacchari]MBO1361797.1 helix-turn-helix transcriptional regulator [Acetobacter sacchari]